MENQFSFVSYLNKLQRAHQEIKDPKEYLFNIVSCCLLKEIRYYDSSEERCNIIYHSLNQVAVIDPEFILKLIVYLRHQLYIRTTTNFLLAFCIMHEKTKPFVQKYFGVSIILPSDLIEVCSYVQFLNYQASKSLKQEIIDIRKKFKFPTILQLCVKEKFPQFSLYQLGKYCSESARKKLLQSYLQFKDFEKFKKIKDKIKQKNKLKELKFNEEEKKCFYEKKNKKLLLKYNIMKHQKAKIEAPKTQFDIKFMCMKDILQYCHCKAPQYSIKCILGKKYPQTEEEFNELFKEEIENYNLKSNKNEKIAFNQELAGHRMKLDIPKTWETELSSKGNKKEVWEELIMQNQLPYMAMIRNLRNILKIGISDIAHQKVIAKLSDSQQVKSAKLFPLQYFSALVEVDKIIELTGKNKDNKAKKMEEEEEEKETKTLQFPQPILNSISQFGPLYKEAINQAINLAVEHNLEEIKGLTVVFADVSGSMCSQISGGKRYGSLRTCMDLALLLGLMIRSKCQACDFYLFSSPGYNQKKPNKLHQKVKLFQGNDYLENIKLCLKQNKLGGGNTGFPGDCIKKYENKKIKIDNIIILSDLMISVNYNEGMDYDSGEMNNNRISEALNGYRNKMNKDLKIFSVDLRGYSQQLNLGDEFNEKNYIRIFGMSDSVLRFISLRESSQMQEIENYAEIKVAEYQERQIN